MSATTEPAGHRKPVEEPGITLNAIMAVFRKDLQSELRTRYAVNAILLFAVTSLFVVVLTIPTRGIGLTFDRITLPNGGTELVVGDTETRAQLLSGLLWVVLFFSAISGLSRVFVKEEEARTASALRLAAQPLAVYFGKLLFNVLLLWAVTVVVTPLFVLLLQPTVRDWLLFGAELLLGAASMAAIATILSAIVAQAGGRSALFAGLAFPLLLFVLVIAINGTAGAFIGGKALVEARNQILALVSYLVVMVMASAALFEQVWSE